MTSDRGALRLKPGWRQLWRGQFDAETEERFVHGHFRRIRVPLLILAPALVLACHLMRGFADGGRSGWLPDLTAAEVALLAAIWMAVWLARDSQRFALGVIAFITTFELHLLLSLPRDIGALQAALPQFLPWPLVIAPLASRLRTFALALAICVCIPLTGLYGSGAGVEDALAVVAFLGLTVVVAFAVYVCSDRARRESFSANLRLEERAGKDALTGLPNRRTFFDACEPLIDRCAAEGQPLALCFVDLDHFKRINDDLGHDVGDRVLVQVAGVIRAQQAGDDLCARIGGEEFIVVWPNLPLAAALQRADALRNAIATVSEPGLPVSASIGLGLRETGESLAELMRRADMALLRAKRGGRNRVELADRELDALPVGSRYS
jgi:diguanylate cyclase (GGDEF)-like protein